MRLTLILALILIGVTASQPGCTDKSAALDSRVFPSYDGGLDLDPVPWFREAGCGGDGHGPCGDAGGIPGPDRSVPDLMQPDQCVPPTSCQVTFKYPKGNEKTVEVAGDFNNWVKQAMTVVGSNWAYTTTFSDGTRVLYKFVVDGTWIPDPNNPKRTQDQYKNSILDVACPNPCGG